MVFSNFHLFCINVRLCIRQMLQQIKICMGYRRKWKAIWIKQIRNWLHVQYVWKFYLQKRQHVEKFLSAFHIIRLSKMACVLSNVSWTCHLQTLHIACIRAPKPWFIIHHADSFVLNNLSSVNNTDFVFCSNRKQMELLHLHHPPLQLCASVAQLSKRNYIYLPWH